MRAEAERHRPITDDERTARRRSQHVAGRLPSERERQLLADLILAAGHQQVGEGDARCPYRDDKVAVWLREIRDDDPVWTVLGPDLQRSHQNLLSGAQGGVGA